MKLFLQLLLSFLVVTGFAAESLNETVLLRVSLLQLQHGDSPVSTATTAFKDAAFKGAHIAVLPAGWLKSNNTEGFEKMRAAANHFNIAVIITTTKTTTTTTTLKATLIDCTGKTVLTHQKVSDGEGGVPTTSTDFKAVQLTIPGVGRVGVGMLLEREYEFFHGPRVLMLQGAEIVLVSGGVGHTAPPPPIQPTASETALTRASHQAFYTRAWENVLGIGLVSGNVIHGGSCAYLGTKDTSTGIGQTLLAPTPPGSSHYLVMYNISALRGNRSDAIWGDAFRRPFAYKSLCGLAGPLSQQKILPLPPPPRTGNDTGATGGVLRVALLQMSPTASELGNEEKAAAMISKAASQGAEIVVMPELFQLGYCSLAPDFEASNVSELYQWTDRACKEGDENKFVSRFVVLAKKLNVAIQASFLRSSADGGPPENAVTLIDRHGDIRLTYSKVHTAVWSQCEAMTRPGNQLKVATLDTVGAGIVNVGSMICADREFPEMPRMVADAGAELMLISNACDLTDWHLAMLRTRAFANGVAIGMANYAAPACNGRSPAFGGQGETLGDPDVNGTEQVVLFEVNITSLRIFRSSAEGVARRKSIAQLDLCDPVKRNNGFERQNPLKRPAHAM